MGDAGLLAELPRAIAGEVIVPGSPAYEAARKPAMALFHDVRPKAIVRCATPIDVASTILQVRECGGAEIAVRSGGHCFAGRSSTDGVVVDVSPMRSVSVADGVATIGAGAKLGEIYDALAPHRLTIAGGCGPAVGIAGLALGGGLGILGRKHGLTCDQLLGAEVVLANGEVVACDEERHGDLFWALRGAGGGQFGVVTSLAFKTLRATVATSFHLTWPHTEAALVVESWQDWSPHAPDDLVASLLVIAGADAAQPPVVHVFGAMLGSEDDAAEMLGQLVTRVGTKPDSAALTELPYRETKRHLAEHGPGEGEPERIVHDYSKSEFFRRPLPIDAIAALVEHIAADRVPGQKRELDFSPWCGAYGRVPKDATAFVHRDALFLLKQAVAIDATASPTETEAARDWLARSWEIPHSLGTGGVYPNFPDSTLEDAISAYHGTNLDRLIGVKATYDPDDVFHFPQSIPVKAP